MELPSLTLIGTLIRLVAAVLAAAAIAACGATGTSLPPTQSHPPAKARLTSGRPAHIAVIVMENAAFGDVIGSTQAPYINGLARRYALAARSYAVSHPSLPNYLALTGGSTFGIDSDCTACSVPGSGLAGQLQAARVSWNAYMEDLPYPCFRGSSAGDYAKKHDPFIYFRDIASSPSACRHIAPLSALGGQAHSHTLPTFLWITPNLCHDMHDCDLGTGDRFLSRFVPPLLNELGSNSLLFLTWDEGTNDDGCCGLATGGHIATIVAGGDAQRGARLSTPVDHYSVLQAVEDLLALRRLRGAACGCTPTLQSLLAR